MLDTQPHEKKEAVQYVDIVICKKNVEKFSIKESTLMIILRNKLHVYTPTHL